MGTAPNLADARLTDTELELAIALLERWSKEAVEQGRDLPATLFTAKAVELGCLVLERNGEFAIAEAARADMEIAANDFYALFSAVRPI